MAAQLEDGFTRIADQILEEIAKYKLNGTQFRILMVVWRYTYGFSRKDHELSLSFFVKATGLGKTQIDRELKNLIEYKVLIVTKESTFTESRKLGFNKKLDEWKIEYSQQKEVQSAKTLTVIESESGQSANMSTGTVSKNADQDIHSFINITTTTDKDPSKIEHHFLKRRAKGLNVGSDDHKAMLELITYGIPSDFINDVVDKVFSEFKPKYPRHTITNFTYCVPRIHQEWYLKLEKEKVGAEDGGTQSNWNDRTGGSNKTVTNSGNAPTRIGIQQSESRFPKGKWDDVDVSLPAVQG